MYQKWESLNMIDVFLMVIYFYHLADVAWANFMVFFIYYLIVEIVAQKIYNESSILVVCDPATIVTFCYQIS